MEPGERFDQALQREVREETGLNVDVGPLLYVSELQEREGRLIILDFGVSPCPEPILAKAGSDAQSLGYFSQSECMNMPLASGMSELLCDPWVRGYLGWN